MNPPAPTCLLGRYPRFSSSEWRLPDFKARAALVRNLDFVLSRPDIAAAPMPEGVGPGDTLGEYALAICPDLPVLPGTERMQPDGVRPADLRNVFRGPLVDAYTRIALDTLERLDREADEAIWPAVLLLEECESHAEAAESFPHAEFAESAGSSRRSEARWREA